VPSKLLKDFIQSQVIKFLLAGLLNTLVAFFVYSGLVTFFAFPFWAANFLAMIISIIGGYLLSRILVFKEASGTPIPKTIIKYLIVIFIQFIVGTLLIAIFIKIGYSEILSYVFVLPISAAISFVLQKRWAFRV